MGKYGELDQAGIAKKRSALKEVQEIIKTLPADDPDRSRYEEFRSRLQLDIHSNPQANGFTGVSAPDEQVAEFVSDTPAYKAKLSSDRAPAPVKKPKRTDLASASGDESIYRPPEHAQKGADPFNYVAWEEPTIEQFREEVGPMLAQAGDDPEQYDEHTPEFKVYADRKYAEAFDRAQKSGQVISRVEYVTHPAWARGESLPERALGYAPGLLTKAKNAAGAAAYGYLEGVAAPGAADLAATGAGALTGDSERVLDEKRFLQQKHPIGYGVGEIAGFLNPVSIPGKVARGAQKLAGYGGGLLRRTASSGVAGAGVGAASGALREGASQLSDVATDKKDAFDSQRIGDRAVIEGLLGGGFGVGGEMLGTGAAALRDKALPPNLRDPAEAVGFNFGLGGIKPPPPVQSAIKEAEAAGVSPDEVMARGMRERVAEAGQSYFEQGQPGVKPMPIKSVRFPFEQDPDKEMANIVASEMWGNQQLKKATGDKVQEVIAANADTRVSAKPLAEYLHALASERPTIPAPGQSSGPGMAPSRIEKLRSLGLWKEVQVPPEKLKNEAERLGGVVSTNATGEPVLLVPRQMSARDAARLWRRVQADPELHGDLALTDKVDELVNQFSPTRVKHLWGNEGRTNSSELWDALARDWDTDAVEFPQRQITAGGKRYQYGRLPKKERAIVNGREMQLTREESAKAMRGEALDVFDEGIPPAELQRNFKYAGIETHNGMPVPWEDMSKEGRDALTAKLQAYPGLSIDEQEALETVADSVPGLPDALKAFKGHKSGLKLMARDKESVPILSLRGYGLGLPGVGLNYSPNSFMTRLNNPLRGLSNNRGAGIGMTGPAADITEEHLRAKERRSKTAKAKEAQ